MSFIFITLLTGVIFFIAFAVIAFIASSMFGFSASREKKKYMYDTPAEYTERPKSTLLDNTVSKSVDKESALSGFKKG